MDVASLLRMSLELRDQVTPEARTPQTFHLYGSISYNLFLKTEVMTYRLTTK